MQNSEPLEGPHSRESTELWGIMPDGDSTQPGASDPRLLGAPPIGLGALAEAGRGHVRRGSGGAGTRIGVMATNPAVARAATAQRLAGAKARALKVQVGESVTDGTPLPSAMPAMA